MKKIKFHTNLLPATIEQFLIKTLSLFTRVSEKTAHSHLLENEERWREYKEKTGFVYQKYVTAIEQKKPAQTKDDYKVETVTAKAVVNTTTKEPLLVRSGPSSAYESLGNVAYGSELTIIGKSGLWYQIEYKDGTGFVYGGLIKIEEETVSEEPKYTVKPMSAVGTVKTGGVDTLNVRSGPATTYKILGELENKTKVDIIGEANGWYQIKYNEGTGFVSRNYVTDVE